MPLYVYECESCQSTQSITHMMSEDPKVTCQQCGEVCYRVIQPVTSYTRGYGYCDVSGCRRDMNLHKLMNDDPYANHRQKGEKDDLANRLKNGGKHNKRRQYYT
jgi:putative FmdB family regulatory protein